MPEHARISFILLTATTTLLAGPGTTHPAAAQEARTRVLVSPNAACREAPSRSAAVVAVLTPQGNWGGWGCG